LPSLRQRISRFAIPSGVAAIAALAIAWALIMHGMGWAQESNYAQVRALAHGKAEIDQYQWETKDKAWMQGHFYAVKAPGLAIFTLPAYLLADAAGKGLVKGAVANAERADTLHWGGMPAPPYAEAGFSAKRAWHASAEDRLSAPVIWFLMLFGALLPALIMLLLVRRLGDVIEPGLGTAAAVTLGLCTMLMTFASEYFSHVMAATLVFGAFALLYRERQGEPRPWLTALAGLLAGLAVTFEYPLGLVGVVLFAYALSRDHLRLPRAAAYAGGALLGALPVLAFNQWAFGSPLEFAYSNAVAVQGFDGHAVLGLNSAGFFGITSPKPSAAVDLLFSSRGLLTITPVIAMAVAGAIAMRRSLHRAEANVILAVAAVYFAYNCGYWLPFGGGTPGPRFLIPTLPFLGLGLATAWKRWPALTLGLAIPSAVFMIPATITLPLIGDNGTSVWGDRVISGEFENTLLTALGVHNGWYAITPVLVGCVLAVWFAARATPALDWGRAPAWFVLGPVALWGAVSAVGPTVAGDHYTPISHGETSLEIIGVGAVTAFLTLVLLRYRGRRLAPAPGGAAPVPVAVGESS
jgi:4-amino-4-deoxy-L-arabinose transferase-like glycosyltransferase